MAFQTDGKTASGADRATCRRNEFLKIRLSTGERIDLDAAAARLNKSVSEFVRDAAMYQAGIVRSVLS